MLHRCVVLLGVPSGRVQPWCGGGDAAGLACAQRERDGGSAPQRKGGGDGGGSPGAVGRLAGWMEQAERSPPRAHGGNGALAVETLQQAWPGFTPYPQSLQMKGEGFQNPMACGLLCSKHRAAAFPSHFLPPLHRTLQDEFFVRQVSPLGHALAPPVPFQDRRAAEGWGRWVQSVCSRQWEGSIPDWMLAPLPPGSSQPRGPLLPSSCWGELCPFVLHTAGRGLPGKGSRKKALRGSRPGAERDSSPFSFTLSFLKGHAKLSKKGI